MKIAGLIKNDVVNGYDVCVSLWVQGCPFHCSHCHNPETWDYNGGIYIDEDNLIAEIDKAISLNGIQRNFSILGGEPLCDANLEFVYKLVKYIEEKYPKLIIFIWTGYEWEKLTDKQKRVVREINYLIDGPYIHEQRDLTLPYRGSLNQRVIDVRQSLTEGQIVLWKERGVHYDDRGKIGITD